MNYKPDSRIVAIKEAIDSAQKMRCKCGKIGVYVSLGLVCKDCYEKDSSQVLYKNNPYLSIIKK